MLDGMRGICFGFGLALIGFIDNILNPTYWSQIIKSLQAE